MKEINKTIEGYNVNGICVGCLNYNRKMFHLDEVNACFKILGNIDVPNDVTIKVCWECLATIRNTMRFKEQIEKSLNNILKYTRMDRSLKAPEDLSQFATQRLGIYKTQIHSYPCLKDDNKIASVKIKSEDYGKDRLCVDHNIVYEVSNSINAGSVSSSDVLKPANLQNIEMHTSVDEPDYATKILNTDITRISSHLEDEDKIISVCVKQEPQDIPIDFDDSGLDIKVEDRVCEDIHEEGDLSSEPVTSEVDVRLLKPQSGPNAWKIKLQGNILHLSYTEEETESKARNTSQALTASDGQQRTAFNPTMADQPEENMDFTDLLILRSRSNVFTEAQDPASSTTARRFPKPPINPKSKAQRQREYRQRIAATRTPAEAIAARKLDAQRQRHCRLRKAANSSLISGSLESTAPSSRSRAGSNNA